MAITKKGKEYVARTWWRTPSGKRQSMQQDGFRTMAAAQKWIDKVRKKNKGLTYEKRSPVNIKRSA